MSEWEEMTVEDLSKNGVRVIRRRFFNEKGQLLGSVVEADCGCYGGSRPHTTMACPQLKKTPQKEQSFKESVNGCASVRYRPDSM